MNLKLRLSPGDKFLGYGKQKEILDQLIDGLKNGSIDIAKIKTKESTKFVCFRLTESNVQYLAKISEKYNLSMSDILREGLKQINLIVHSNK